MKCRFQNLFEREVSMNILEQGCTCNHCLSKTKVALLDSRAKWLNGERKIEFKPYHYTCGDGCCDEYGTEVYVNGFQITRDGENVESVIECLMEFLEIENFSIIRDYENYDDDEEDD